jgi:hypothetical protein
MHDCYRQVSLICCGCKFVNFCVCWAYWCELRDLQEPKNIRLQSLEPKDKLEGLGCRGENSEDRIGEKVRRWRRRVDGDRGQRG